MANSHLKTKIKHKNLNLVKLAIVSTKKDEMFPTTVSLYFLLFRFSPLCPSLKKELYFSVSMI